MTKLAEGDCSLPSARNRRRNLRRLVRPSIVSLALAVLGVLGWNGYRAATTPRFEGKTAAQWFQEFRAAQARHQIAGEAYMRTPLGPQRVRTTHLDEFGLFHDPAADGLRGLGTNAVPFLARQVTRQDGAVALAYAKCYRALPGSLRGILPSPPQSREAVRADAARALRALGTDAASAVPALLKSLQSATLFSRSELLLTLRQLPFKPGEIDPVLRSVHQHEGMQASLVMITTLSLRTPTAAELLCMGLTNSIAQTRRACMSQLQFYGDQAATVVPTLVAALEVNDPQVRTEAAHALEVFGPKAASALNNLCEALRQGDDEMRYVAARALAAMGTNALPALPLLLQATNDPSVMVQRVAARILQKFQPPATSP